VPDGFVLTAGQLDDAERGALATAYARLGGSVAVRSSSTAEDLATASFAGQYHTSLDVRGESAIVDAVRGCLVSATDGHAYARIMEAPDTGAMAVLVQRFVEPRAAGVAFTRHPHDPTAILVESHGGRGDALVSGIVTPDAYVLERDSGAIRTGQVQGSLDAADLALVAGLARRIEAILGAPQDVEWAIGPEGPVVLQARPITVETEERADPRARRLTRANVGEVLPDPVTPLTWSTVCGFLEHGFHVAARRGGLLPEEAGSFLVLHRRRLYLNLTLSAATGMRLPGISAADAERLILGGQTLGPDRPRWGPSELLRVFRVAVRLVAMARRLPSEIDDACARVAALPDRALIATAGEARLARLLRAFAEVGHRIGEVHVATSGASAFRLALLRQLVERWSLGDSTDLVNRLVAGVTEVESAAPALALESIAAEARERAEWKAWLLGRDGATAAADLERGAAPEGLASRIAAFLRAYGHRSVSEGELAASSWRDDPAPLFTALRALLASRRPPGFGHRARAEERQASEQAVLRRLGVLRRLVFALGLAGAQAWVRERERTKAAAVSMVNHGRRLVRAAAQRLLAAGRLRRADDVYFLTFSELLGAVEGNDVPLGTIERRRRRHEREGRLPAPRDVDLDAPDVATAPSTEGFSGTGVSAGAGIGPARVVHAGETPRIEPGEVLVAPVLDAAMGPLLASAAAAVAEIGGMLSHGSVVARELGVPCVVDVRDATHRIHDGARLLVDGSSGRVSVLTEDARAGEARAAVGPALEAADPADERFHPLEPHPLGRESVYVNAQDPATGLRLIATAGVRRHGRAEALVAIALPDGRVLFGLDLRRARVEREGFAVGDTRFDWMPTTLRVDGRLSLHDQSAFPPGPLPLLLEPRTVPVTIDLAFSPTTPAVDLCGALSAEARRAVLPLGRCHVEQSGRWIGIVRVDEKECSFDGTGSRDHSWGLRDWTALDYSRLFTVRFGDDVAVHALTMSARGRPVEGGFLWREGRLETITRIECASEREAGRVRSFELQVSVASGSRYGLLGSVERTLTIPVQVERRLSRHLAGRCYSLLLHESFTRYEMEGRVGHGMAEFSERPR
jgi:pyruvate,water dikinase